MNQLAASPSVDVNGMFLLTAAGPYGDFQHNSCDNNNLISDRDAFETYGPVTGYRMWTESCCLKGYRKTVNTLLGNQC